MAYTDKVIVNPAVGQRIKFLRTARDTEGRLLEMEAVYNSSSKEPPQHYHPFQDEHFTIIKGQMTLRMDGETRVLNAGDTLHIPAKKSHSMWNNSGQESIMNWKVTPAMTTENLFETFAGLAVEGKTNENGTPKFLQVVLVANKFGNVFRLSKPPYAIQKIVFFILTPFAYVAGYKPTYKKYFR